MALGGWGSVKLITWCSFLFVVVVSSLLCLLLLLLFPSPPPPPLSLPPPSPPLHSSSFSVAAATASYVYFMHFVNWIFLHGKFQPLCWGKMLERDCPAQLQFVPGLVECQQKLPEQPTSAVVATLIGALSLCTRHQFCVSIE